MVKAIVWDMGGVLSNETDFPSRENWERRLQLQPGELAHMVFYHPITPRLVVGEVHPNEMWQAIGEDLGLTDEEVRQLSADFWGEPVWNQDLLDYISSLKGHYKLGVLSDAWVTTREAVQEHINDSLFDVIMFSGEEGLRKPDPEYFQRMLSRLGVQAEEAIYVDDRIQNVAGAERVGIFGIHYSAEMDTRKVIDQITEAVGEK